MDDTTGALPSDQATAAEPVVSALRDGIPSAAVWHNPAPDAAQSAMTTGHFTIRSAPASASPGDLRLEASARAIAAVKRGLKPSDTKIDAVWTTYVGQAKAAILAFIEEVAGKEKAMGWQLSRPLGLERRIEWFKRRLPGWWFTVGECQLSADASCGPTRESPHIALIPLDKRFDDGFHADLPQPATMAEALHAVMREAVGAIRAAQAIEAGTAETQSGSVYESAFRQDAPKENPHG